MSDALTPTRAEGAREDGQTAYEAEDARVQAALKVWNDIHDTANVDDDPEDLTHAAMTFAICEADKLSPDGQRAARAEAEVARLTAENERMREAMKPIAAWLDKLDAEFADHEDSIIAGGLPEAFVTFGDLRAALAALQGGEND